MPSEPLLHLKIDRNSVCAGDDTDPHDIPLSLPASATVADLLTEVTRRHFLASISGGKATWLIMVPGFRREPIGVAAQQWDAPQFVIAPETRLATLFGDGEPSVFFRYWEQSDPERVFACLQAGTPLPPVA